SAGLTPSRFRQGLKLASCLVWILKAFWPSGGNHVRTDSTVVVCTSGRYPGGDARTCADPCAEQGHERARTLAGLCAPRRRAAGERVVHGGERRALPDAAAL